MVADTRHYFYASVRQDVHLLDDVLPEFVAHYHLSERREIACGVLSVDVSRGDDEVRGVAGAFHHAVVVVHVIVVPVLRLYPYHGHSLSDGDIYVAALRLIAFRCLDEGCAQHERFLDASCVYVRQGFVDDGVASRFLQIVLHGGGVEEAVGHFISYTYVHLGAYRRSAALLAYGCKREEQVNGEYYIAGDEEYFAPVLFHFTSFL